MHPRRRYALKRKRPSAIGAQNLQVIRPLAVESEQFAKHSTDHMRRIVETEDLLSGGKASEQFVATVYEAARSTYATLARKRTESDKAIALNSVPGAASEVNLAGRLRREISIAENMQRSIAALGSAMAQIPTPVSPQLARAAAATEQAWRDLDTEFGLLTNTEVSQVIGSDSPSQIDASSLRSQGKLIAVKRPGGLRYPGFQFNRAEHSILPVMEKLIILANAAGRSETSLALWMTHATGYLEGGRPVDSLADPEKVIHVAKQSFGVQW